MGTNVIDKTKRRAEGSGKQAARQAEPGLELLARLGYAARGLVYIIVGYLALQAANGAGSPNVDQRRALQAILNQPFGRVSLTIVAVGLLCYALWRLFEAAAAPEGEETGKRVGYALAGIGYAALALFAWQVLRGTGSHNNAPQDITAKVMRWPMGHWLVALIGLGIVGVGLYQIYQAYAYKFEMRFKSGELTGQQRQVAIRLGRAGFAAKGLVYAIIGILILQAGLTYDPRRAGGLGEALQTLAGQPYGAWVLAITALGLLAYGLYSLALAAFRRIQFI